jgi:DNA polymerase
MNASDVTYASISHEAKRLKISMADILSTITRNAVVPESDDYVFGIADYASVEAVGTAWLAGCESLLDAFRNGRDVYCEFGSEHLFNRTITKADKAERFAAKTTVLGCQYQMGAQKFATVCEGYGIDLSAVGLSARTAVETYRKAHPEIVQLWKNLNDAALRAVRKPGGTFDASMVTFESNGEHLAVVLPSGRVLRYWLPEIRMEVPTAFDSPKAMPVLYYRSTRGFDATLYGGKLAENIVQGFTRDILASKLVIGIDAGFRVPLHVHDEGVFELKKKNQAAELAKMCALMSETSGFWYEDFPLTVEGFTAPRYSKIHYPSSVEAVYRNGKKV